MHPERDDLDEVEARWFGPGDPDDLLQLDDDMHHDAPETDE